MGWGCFGAGIKGMLAKTIDEKEQIEVSVFNSDL